MKLKIAREYETEASLRLNVGKAVNRGTFNRVTCATIYECKAVIDGILTPVEPNTYYIDCGQNQSVENTKGE